MPRFFGAEALEHSNSVRAAPAQRIPSTPYSTSRGLGSFALRCSSAAGQYDSFAGSAGDGRFWTQLGAYKAVLARGDLYAASEAFVNSEDVYGCADAGAVITQITVVYDDAAKVWIMYGARECGSTIE